MLWHFFLLSLTMSRRRWDRGRAGDSCLVCLHVTSLNQEWELWEAWLWLSVFLALTYSPYCLPNWPEIKTWLHCLRGHSAHPFLIVPCCYRRIPLSRLPLCPHRGHQMQRGSVYLNSLDKDLAEARGWAEQDEMLQTIEKTWSPAVLKW